MQIFVMGGTGLIGSSLVDRLTERGDRVVVLTRRPTHAQARWGSQCTIVEGDPMKAGPWMQAAKDCDAVINLVGESIFARRWNDEFKKLLERSGIQKELRKRKYYEKPCEARRRADLRKQSAIRKAKIQIVRGKN